MSGNGWYSILASSSTSSGVSSFVTFRRLRVETLYVYASISRSREV